MAGVSRYRAQKWLEDTFTNSTVYLALYSSNPGKENTGTEISGGGYERLEIPMTEPYEDNGKDSVKLNETVFFPEATSDWGTVTHGAIFDSKTGGNMEWYGPLATSRDPKEGDEVVVRENEIVVTLN